MARFLLSPDQAEGTPTPTSTVNPAFQAPPTGAVGGPPIPMTLSLTVDEYNRYRAIERSLAEMTAQQARVAKEAEDARLLVVAESGNSKKALQETNDAWQKKVDEATGKYTKLEGSLFASHQETVLGAALAGVVFAGETAEDKAEAARQLRAILEPLFETSRDGSGAIITRDKVSGRPAADVLKEALASKKYQHFFSAQSRGGSGTDGTRAAAKPTPTSVDGYKTVAQFAAEMAATGGLGAGGGFGRK